MGVEIPYEQNPKNFNPQYIVHAWLTILPRNSGDPVEFGLKTRKINHTKVDEFASLLATSVAIDPQIPGLPFATPWDIGFDKQCYVVIELDRGVPNWRFRDKAMVSKEAQVGRRPDFNLRWVDHRGESHRTTIPTVSQCRVIYFSIAERSKKEPSHQVDLFAEFWQGNLTMPVVFDPDVKNDGGFDVP